MTEKSHSVNISNNTLTKHDGVVWQNDGTSVDYFDLCRDGPIDQCTEMLLEKVMAPFFWNGAEQFVAQPAPLGGYELVRKALSRHIRHFLGELIPWDHLLLLPNTSIALELFVRCCCSPGDVVLCPIPFADDELLRQFRSANATIDFVPVNWLWNSSHSNSAELQQTMEQMGKRTVRALLLHNPHPIFGLDNDGQRQMAHVLEWATERGIFLLVDESLATLDSWEFISCLGLDRSRLVWIWNAANHFSLPGLDFAAILLPKADLMIGSALPLLQIHPCAPLVQYLAANLLEDLDWSSELFARRKSRIEQLKAKTIEGMAELGLSRTIMTSTKPTSWILVDLKTFLDDINFESERALKEEFLQKAQLKLTSGEQLGMNGAGWFRIRVESNEDKVSEVLRRLRTVLVGRKKSILEWEKKDMRIYGGGEKTGAVWAAEGGTTDEQQQREEKEEEEKEGKDKKETEGEEEKEKGKNGQKEAKKEKWANRQEEEEEEMVDEEFLRQIFTFEEFRKKEKMEGKREEEEKDEIIEKVFSIFTNERLQWKGFIEEKSPTAEREETFGEKVKEKSVGEKAEEGTQMPNGTELWKGTINNEKNDKKQKRSKAKVVSTTIKMTNGKGREEKGEEYYDEISTEEEGTGEGERQTEEYFDTQRPKEYSDLSVSNADFMESICHGHSVFDHHASDSNLEYNHQHNHCSLNRSDSGMVGELPSAEFGLCTLYDPIVIHPPTEFFPNGTVHSRDSAFLSDSSPTHSSTLIRKSDERNYGPTAQMMNDSGIFVDFLPGSLSIDFPLLVSTEKLMTQDEEGNEEGIIRSLDDQSAITVELQFKTSQEFTGEELRRTVVTSPGNERQKEEKSQEDEPFEVAGWRPLEEIGAEEEQITRMRLVQKKAQENTFSHDEFEAQKKLASALNEGSTFCPKKQEVSWVEVNGDEPKEIGGVLLWKPLDELGSEEERGFMEEQKEQQFNDKMDHLEKRKRSLEATDVVEEWNTRVRSKVREEETEVVEMEEEEIEVELNFGGRTKNEAATEVQLGRDWTNRRTTTIQDTEAGREVEIPVHFENDIPGRARYFQIHQRIKMGRKLEDDNYKKSLPRNTIILEHMNITELEYNGGTVGGERVQTSICTQINRWAPDELFRHIPTREEPTEKRGDRVKTLVEVREQQRRKEGRSNGKDGEGRIAENRKGKSCDTSLGNNESLPQLYSEFETAHHGETDNEVKRTARTQHRQKWQQKGHNQTNSPSRITVTTTFGKGEENGEDDGLHSDRVTVTHTPGSRWIVSSVYHATDWGWEKVSLPTE